MNASTPAPAGFGALLRQSACQALQWRLLLLWWAGLSLPALLIFLPAWRALAGVLDNSLRAADLASGWNVPLIAEMITTVMRQGGGALPAVGLAGLGLTLLLSPWLTGMALAAARQGAGQRLGFGELLRGGLSEYGRLFRMMLWALLPLGLAFAVGSGLGKAADHHAEHAVLESSADLAGLLATLALLLLVLLAHATVDAGRAQFAVQLRKRSAVKAWWRGLRVLGPRQWRGLLAYLLVTLVAAVGVAAFTWLRLQAPGLLVPAWHLPLWLAGVIALVAGQLVILALAWMRCARLFALVAQARLLA